MNFDDSKVVPIRGVPAAEVTFPEPKEGDRICEECEPRVALVMDLSKPGYEHRCPKCGRFEEWFGLRFLRKTSNTDEHQ